MLDCGGVPKLRSLFEDITASSETLAVILHGSYAKEIADQYSDIDLIVVKTGGVPQHDVIHLDDRHVDLFITTLDSLEKQCFTAHPDNSNFALKALVEGKVLYQRDGSLENTMSRAKELWIRGPERPSSTEREQIEFQIRRMVGNASKAVARAEGDPFRTHLAEIRLHQVFVRILYKYQRLHGWWASDLGEMMPVIVKKQPNLYRLCHSIVEGATLVEKVRKIRELADSTLGEDMDRRP